MALVEFDDVWVRTTTEGKRVRLAESSPSVFEEPLRAVVLKEPEGERAVAIWMGSADAFSLVRHQRGIGDGRPVAAGVMAALLDATGGHVAHVEITSVHENVCYAGIVLEADGRSTTIDARPSDALNLAVRVGAPILVAEAVMTELAFPIDHVGERLEHWQQGGDAGHAHWQPLSATLTSQLREANAA